VLGTDPLRLANVGLAGDHVVPPEVATGNHVAGTTGALEDDHVLDRLAAAQRNALVDGRLERDLLAATALLVGGNHRHGTGVVDPVTYRLRREAAKYDRVNGADARAGLHRDNALDAHRHVDHTRSPFLMPRARRPLANWLTRASSSW
jgi:hypothetical protein